ncbi:MAG: redoxin family protein [Clostridia bacterium]|nr:redoxin family protein [Clostridia bacterium]
MEDTTSAAADTEQMDKSMESEEMADNLLDQVLYDIDGNVWNLAKLNQKAVVKLWASWCPICLSGMEEYNAFTGEYKDAQVLTVVSPGLLGEKNKEDFLKWYKSLEDYDDIIVILDEEGILVNGLGVRGFPTYVYIDSSGYVESTAIGHQQTDVVIDHLNSME